MKYFSKGISGHIRILILLSAFILYFVLFWFNIVLLSTPISSLQWAFFGISSFISLLFLAIAIIVWLYARDRFIAVLIFAFSSLMMVIFAGQGLSVGTLWLNSVTAMLSMICVWLLCLLMSIFPTNFLMHNDQTHHRLPFSSLFFVRGMICFLGCFCLFVAGEFVLNLLRANGGQEMLSDWLYTMILIYYATCLIGCLGIAIIAYNASAIREQQQMRIFIGGVILSITPLLILTVAPSLLHWPVIDGRISVVSVCFFPLSLGYAILRYQILILDTYVRRIVTWITGGIFLTMWGYLVIALCIYLWHQNTLIFGIIIISIAVIFAPFIWYFALNITERLFFSEIRYYRRLLFQPTLLNEESLNLDEIARILCLAVVQAFETPAVALFVLDESYGCFRIFPSMQDGARDQARKGFVRTLNRLFCLGKDGILSDWLGTQVPLIQRLTQTKRPMLLSEALQEDGLPFGLRRYLRPAREPLETDCILLAPVRAQGKMIAMLCIGERGDGRPYAGPDFEVVQMLLARFSSVIETARLYVKANQHVVLLDTLYQAAGSTLGQTFTTLEAVAQSYAQVAMKAIQVRAEVWIYDEEQNLLRRLSGLGGGVHVIEQSTLALRGRLDWEAWFCDHQYVLSDQHISGPPCLVKRPSCPIAWLPLVKKERRLGVLVLMYPRPHFFLGEEMRVLEMFADQCAASLEDARITLELIQSYERQKELDRLKDQFIMTTSHELRTPLTAIQGYIELLQEYNDSLAPDMRAEFIAKAYRGCEELVLMVGNIMDASKVQTDSKTLNLIPVVPSHTITHVLEILEAMISRESRKIVVKVPDQFIVLGDTARLRQILLNLLGNALKYSPAGSPIEICAENKKNEVVISIRDYGLGIPLVAQKQLFERFTRLDRDMNSAVRGAGLGLYICKQLVEAMGGTIWVESCGEPGRGSIFYFTLHRAPTEQAMPVSV